MCGIAGLTLAVDAIGASSVEAVRRMTERMRFRGPDAEGFWQGNGVALGHRRLAIQDLDPRSTQPMVSADGNSIIVFNGEIYNFRELRAELEADGVRFRTTSDTEVLLALYARQGEQMLARLRGMFAFAIWDVPSSQLFLARDPYGIKPLYYSQTGQGLIFASQVKALEASGMISASREPAAIAGFYLWGSVPEPWTLHSGVLALPAGCWLRWRAGSAEAPVCWNDIRVNWRQEQSRISSHELEERVRAAVRDSVRAHLVSDVPVSVFLSGGIDSGAIAGLASELGAKVEGITIGFDEFSSTHEDEIPMAAAVAAHYGLRHSIRRVTRDEFERDVPLILDAMDQPSVDGVNTWFASKAVAERGYKVVLSGVGGDELFYGYSFMKQLPRQALFGKAVGGIPGLRSMLEIPSDYLSKGRAHPKVKGVPEFLTSVEGAYFLKRCLFLPNELSALMGEEEAKEGLARLSGSPPGISKAEAVNGGGAVCLLDSTLYLRNQLLRDSDWASMQHSLELRTPLVDATLLETMKRNHASFIGGEGKRMLAIASARSIPEQIVNRPKSGFDMPMARWLSLAATGNGRTGAALPVHPKAPWTRQWAMVVAGAFLTGGSPSMAL